MNLQKYIKILYSVKFVQMQFESFIGFECKFVICREHLRCFYEYD